jgi:hypothetical protein
VVLNAPQSDVASDIRRLADFINAPENFDGGNNGLNISLPKGQR